MKNLQKIQKRIDELLEQAHDSICLDVLIEHGLNEQDQAEYYALREKLFNKGVAK